MSVATRDGAWLSITLVARLDCDRCGTVEVSRWPRNAREQGEMIAKHAREKHGGIWR